MTDTSLSAPTRTVDVDGVPFAYRDLGQGSGTPIVLLHHFTAVIDDWDPRILDGLAGSHRVIAFDNRGVGGTGGETPKTVGEMADDAVAFISALGLTKVHLLGFSMGGFVAQVIAIRHPDLIAKLILAGTGPAGTGGEPGGFAAMVQGAAQKAAASGKHIKHLLFFSPTPSSQAAGDAFLARLQERTEDRVPPLRQEAMMAHIAAISAWAQDDSSSLSSVQHPTFIANGDDDTMVPTPLSLELRKQIANSRLSIYPDAGHGGIFQYHDLFVEQTLDFLEEAASAA